MNTYPTRLKGRLRPVVTGWVLLGLLVAGLTTSSAVPAAASDGLQFFRDPQNWTNEAFYGDRATHFADVTGDGRQDAIAVNSGGVDVRRSNGSALEASERWTNKPFYGDRGTYFADVDGDGRSDAIVVNTGGIVVRPSTGWSFGENQTWSSYAYYGDRGTYFADVDGDGRSDAIVVNGDGITVRRAIVTEGTFDCSIGGDCLYVPPSGYSATPSDGHWRRTTRAGSQTSTATDSRTPSR